MEARAAFEERPFSGLRGDGEGLEGGRSVAIISVMRIYGKGRDVLVVKEGKNDGRDRLFLILGENVERVCLVGGEYKM